MKSDPASPSSLILQTFFEKFDQFADAPNAVSKMRELVLELAIQGQLVPQDSNDEPAFNQLERIAEKKAKAGRVVRRKSGRATNSVAEETETHIPDGWAKSCLADLVAVLNGRAYSKDELLASGTPVLRVGNLFTSSHWYYSNLELETDKYCDQGDLIFAWSASFGPFIWAGPKVIYHYHIWKLEFHSEADLNRGYLYWFLQNKTQEIKRAGHGVSMLHMTKEKMEKLEVMVPPLAEQKRIVAKVDELMALCDRLEAQQQKRETRHTALARAALVRFADAPTPANLQFLFHSSYTITPADLRKSILTLAVQGKLLPQDPNDEPAEELLVRSLAERRKLKRTNETEVQALAGEDALGYDIPESWRWQRLDELLIFGPTNGFSPKAVDYETPVRSLTLSATTSGRFKGEHSKFIATEVPADADLWLRDCDILVQRGNTIEYVGVAAVYRGEPNLFIYPDLMMKLRVSSAFDVGFIHLAMSHEAARDFLRTRASGTSGSMPKINQTTLKSLPLPIPPLAEQSRIVAKVDQLMALVDQLEDQLSATRAIAANLLAALVAELTTQV